jgi:hypothetical protein
MQGQAQGQALYATVKLALRAAMVQDYRIGIRRRAPAPVVCGY